MIDFVAAVASESETFAAAARTGELTAPVPSCPDWNLADLVWHLAEVQDFWGAIVEYLLADPKAYSQPPRPADDELIDFFVDRSARLVGVLGERDAADSCWSWHDEGHSVRWVRRRQAHEALIHRIDAELAVGVGSQIEKHLAADGVDEILASQIDGPTPEWGSVVLEERTALIGATDAGQVWGVQFGRFQGTSPESNETYDLDTFIVTDPPLDPDLTIGGPASSLDRWLWGRSDGSDLRSDGDTSLKDRIRGIATEATQ